MPGGEGHSNAHAPAGFERLFMFQGNRAKASFAIFAWGASLLRGGPGRDIPGWRKRSGVRLSGRVSGSVTLSGRAASGLRAMVHWAHAY